MHAIFQDGGKQYRVQVGDVVLVETRELDGEQKSLSFPTVLMVGEGAGAKFGLPYVEGASVTGEIVEAIKTKRVKGMKHKRRKGYFNRWGHRQQMLRVRITDIKG
jgi:large subunit ribosomal protein L21